MAKFNYTILCFVICLSFLSISCSIHFNRPYRLPITTMNENRDIKVIASMLPGDPMVGGTVSLGLLNVIGLYTNIIFARIALSWFPQLPRQFPILKPIFIVTEPYLRVFRRAVPTVGGYDISAIPAVLMLNFLSQATAAIGVEMPEKHSATLQKSKFNRKGSKYSASCSCGRKQNSVCVCL